MSTIALPLVDPFQLPPGPVWRFSVDDYHRLIASGILDEDDRVELLEGWIVPKMPHNPPHDGTIQLVSEQIRSRLSSRWVVRIQSAVVTNDSVPEPDIAVVRGDSRSYLTRHPGPADIGLIVEVADSTLERDRRQKVRIYAREKIPACWIVHLVDHQVEVFADPSDDFDAPAYRKCEIFRSTDILPFELDGQLLAEFRVADLLSDS